MSGASEVPAERDEAIIAEASVEVIRAALKWADWCAGQGICAVESEGVTAPDDFLMAYTDKTGDEEWGTMADRIADRASRPVDTGREKALEGWQDISTAPKDRPIIGLCVHKADPYFLGEGGLTTYGAHAEGLGYVEDGMHVLVWGGEYDDPDDGYIPPWWFRSGSEWEEVANPTHWMPINASALANPENGRG